MTIEVGTPVGSSDSRSLDRMVGSVPKALDDLALIVGPEPVYRAVHALPDSPAASAFGVKNAG